MKILFIYNAHSTLFAQLSNVVHKMLLPDTYPCNLYKLTYGAATMKATWKEYLESTQAEKKFLYKDEFLKRYPKQHIALPAVVKEEDNRSMSLLRHMSSKPYIH